MISVLSIKSCDGGDGIKIVTESDGAKNTYTVSADFFLECGIQKGVFEDSVLDDIIEEDSIYKAKRAALRIITSGQCSKKKLYEKLRLRGFSHECAKNAADFAFESGYIDEDFQIESYLKTLLEKKHFGRRKVIPMLIAKGYSGDAVCRILDEKYTDEDFKNFRREFLTEKFGKSSPDTAEESFEMKKALYKNGF